MKWLHWMLLEVKLISCATSFYRTDDNTIAAALRPFIDSEARSRINIWKPVYQSPSKENMYNEEWFKDLDPGEGAIFPSSVLSTGEPIYILVPESTVEDLYIYGGESHGSPQFHSASGYDSPSWEDLETLWDNVTGVKNIHKRAYLIPNEVEIGSLFLDKGGALAAQKELEASILSLGRGNKNIWSTWSLLGNTHRVLGDLSKAMNCFRRALVFQPSPKPYADILLNMAAMLFNIGYLSDAEFLLTQSNIISPNGVLQLFLLGNVKHSLGHVQESVALYRQCLKLQPQFQLAKKALMELEDMSPDTDSSLSMLYSGLRANIGLVFIAAGILLFFTPSSKDTQTSTKKKKRRR